MGPRNQPQAPGTRPSPTRPIGKRTRTPLRPAPTKRLPGISATDADQLRISADRILSALDKNDWPEATKETNRLGALWIRFKPGKIGTMSAAEMKDFDARYASLQKNVRARNKAKTRKDAQDLKRISIKMKT